MTAPVGGQLAATFEQHKLPILAGAGAAVVGLAVYKRRRNVNASTSAAPTPSGAPTTSSYYSTGGQTGGMGGLAGSAYDSTSSDLMGALDPQLSSIAAQLSSLTNTLNQPLPVPAQDPTPAPVLADPRPPAPPTVTPQQAPAPLPVSQPTPQPYGPQYVTVNRGDTLSGIAAKYPQAWITPTSIASLNGIRNKNLIYPQQRLRIY